jgi:cobalt-precorrin-5B (C1)-methyltransferase
MPVTDPVTRFEIPAAWIDIAGPNALEKIKSGLWVLLSDGRILRRGLTTGTTAAAACKGAVLSLMMDIMEVDLMTPAGIRVSLPVNASSGVCSAFKDSGDHQFDVTDGIEISAVARAAIARATEARASPAIELKAGKGIGRISRSWRDVQNQEDKAAISRPARKQIMDAIREGLVETGLEGIIIELRVPLGEEVAKKTLNPRLGVMGGISILGSTGFVEPWNEHLGESRAEEIIDAPKVLATTGRTGLKYSRILFPDHKAVLIGSHLDRLMFKADQDSIICGLPALILKWAWPQMLEGTAYNTVAEMVEKEPDHPHIGAALRNAKARLPFTRIVLLQRDGRIFRDLR